MEFNENIRTKLVNKLTSLLSEFEINKSLANRSQDREYLERLEIEIFLNTTNIKLIQEALIKNKLEY